MGKIIYIAFWFNSHWCSGTIQIAPDKISYWDNGSYKTEFIKKRDYLKKVGNVIKTESGLVIIINKTKIKYFLKNKIVTLHIKCQT